MPKMTTMGEIVANDGETASLSGPIKEDDLDKGSEGLRVQLSGGEAPTEPQRRADEQTNEGEEEDQASGAGSLPNEDDAEDQPADES